MRVTHVITRLIVGGAQENTIATVLGLLRKYSLDVDLISGPGTGPEGTLENEFSGAPGVLKILPSLVRPLSPFHDTRACLQLRTLFRRRRPDLVHTHSGKAGFLGRLAARSARIPFIVHTIHGPSFGPFQPTLPNRLYRTAERLAARYTTHFISVAQAMTDQYLRAGIGHPAQFTRVFSGFELGPFQRATNDPELRARLSLARDDVVVGKIGRLFELKGHDDLLEIAPDLVRRHPRLKFLFLGDGPWRTRLESKAERLGLKEKIVFAGLVPPQAVPDYVGIMDLLVHLSRREGLPRALPQALAAGRPVIAYDCDGAREICVDNETGFLVQPGDSSTLVARLSQLVSDPALRRRLGDCGRDRVARSFSVDQMVSAIYELYVRLGAAS